MKNIFSAIILLFFGAISCTPTPVSTAEILGKEALPYTKIVKIDPSKDVAIKVDSQVFIESYIGSFMYEGGGTVTEEINLEVNYYNSLLQIVSAGLETVSTEGLLLATEGMFHIKASVASGKKIEINPTKPLKITKLFPKGKNVYDYAFYEGKADDDRVLWTNPRLDNSLGPIPFDVLFFHIQQNLSNHEHFKTDLNQQLKPNHQYILNYLCDSIDLVQYQNTIVANPAFFNRIYSAAVVMDNKKVNFDREDWFERKLNYILSMVFKLELPKMNYQQLDSFILSKADTSSYRYYTYRHCRSWEYDRFSFSPNNHVLVDTVLLNAIQKAKNYDPSLAFQYQDSIVVLRERNSSGWNYKLIDSELIPYQLSGPRDYFISFFDYQGWLNIDKLIRGNLKLQKLRISVVNADVHTSVALLLKSEKVVLWGGLNNGHYEFKYKLPRSAAIVIVLNTKGASLKFAQKEILIGRDTDITLDLKPSTKEEIQAALEKIEAGYAK